MADFPQTTPPSAPGSGPGGSTGRGPAESSEWVLPEDGIVDPIAVEIAAAGSRRVALTPAERLLAAARILAAGHPQAEISRRLHVPLHVAHALAYRVRRLGLVPVPDLWLLAYSPIDPSADPPADALADLLADAAAPAA
ncbi:hypothetical protein ACQP1W_36890 [Spirillospora sp. CA-255316]